MGDPGEQLLLDEGHVQATATAPRPPPRRARRRCRRAGGLARRARTAPGSRAGAARCRAWRPPTVRGRPRRRRPHGETRGRPASSARPSAAHPAAALPRGAPTDWALHIPISTDSVSTADGRGPARDRRGPRARARAHAALRARAGAARRGAGPRPRRGRRRRRAGARLRQLGDGRLRGARRRHPAAADGDPVRLDGGRRVACRPPARARGRAQGEAIEISTGAMVPTGADAVIRVEDTDGGARAVAVRVAVEPGHNIRRAGEDIEAGRARARAPAPSRPGRARRARLVGRVGGRLRAPPAGHRATTGDELRSPVSRCARRGPQLERAPLPALVERGGRRAAQHRDVADDPEATTAALGRALDAELTVVSRRGLGRPARPRAPGVRPSSASSRSSGVSRCGPASRPSSGRADRGAGLRAARQPGLGDRHLHCSSSARRSGAMPGPPTRAAPRDRDPRRALREAARARAHGPLPAGAPRRRLAGDADRTRAPTCSPRCWAPTRWRSCPPSRATSRPGQRLEIELLRLAGVPRGGSRHHSHGAYDGAMEVELRLFAMLRERAGRERARARAAGGGDGGRRARGRRARARADELLARDAGACGRQPRVRRRRTRRSAPATSWR